MTAQRLANLGSWERDDITGNASFSDEMLRILGMPARPPSTLAEFLNYVHSEDRKYVSDDALRTDLAVIEIDLARTSLPHLRRFRHSEPGTNRARVRKSSRARQFREHGRSQRGRSAVERR
jgi:hypothetical protein